MLEFFSMVAGFFETVFDMLLNIVQSTLTLFAALRLGSSFTGVVLAFFPPLIAASFTAVVAIAIVKLIVGR